MKDYLELTYLGQVRRLRVMAWKALEAFAMSPETVQMKLINHAENTTFRIRSIERDEQWVLRIHRPGYQSKAMIQSELDWLSALRESTSVVVPEPVVGHDSSYIQTVCVKGVPEARHCVLFTWIHGSFVQDRGNPSYFRKIGHLTAELHEHVQCWEKPKHFVRHRLDADGLLSAKGIWGDPSRAPGLSEHERSILKEAIRCITSILDDWGTAPERFGLVHGDLHRGNVLLQKGKACVIDFDDSSFCWFVYDATVSLFFLWGSEQYDEALAAWLEGYRSLRTFTDEDVAMIPVFYVVRKLGLLAWLGMRDDNPKLQKILKKVRSSFVQVAEDFVQNYAPQ